jgi:2Fe-2S ferredoxin
MPRITFTDHKGVAREVDAKNGESLMEAAVKNDVPDLDAECGGACACATCHVYVNPEFLPLVGQATGAELDMLSFAENVRPNSRLSCQIVVTDALEGLDVSTPEAQS